MKKQNNPICIISFSSRANGSCHNCDYECFSKKPTCPHLEYMEQTLIKSILSSALAYFIVPNYCDFPCAKLLCVL